MSEQDGVTLNTPNEAAEEADKPNVEETSADEESEDASKLKELNKKLYERAKKAEAKVKALETKVKEVPEATPDKPDELTQKDLLAIVRANVSDEDISEVSDYAKLKKISVAEALKTQFIKSLLKDKEEERKSAQVANTGGSKRTSSKPSDEQVLANFERGVSPKNDDEWEALHRAKMARRK